MPPGTGKSTLIKFLLAYIAGKFPTSANMYVSYSDGMIKMMGSFTLLRLLGMAGMMNVSFSKEELITINTALNRVKKI